MVEGEAHAAAEAWKGDSVDLVNASVNVLNASVNAVQTAEAGNTNLYADRITITSILNKSDTSANPAAKAEMSAGGGFSGGSVRVNKAKAVSNATAIARVCNANIGGIDNNVPSLTIKTEATSFASAVLQNGSRAGFIGAGVILMEAEAQGNFQAGIDTNGTVKAGTIDIDTDYTVGAKAEVSNDNVSGNGFSGSYNEAKATTKPYAATFLSGDGMIIASGDVSLLTEGDATARAEYKAPTFSLEGATIVATKLTATLSKPDNGKPTQEAKVDIANFQANSGKVTVESRYNASRTESDPGAKAVFGGMMGKASLASAEVHILSAIDESWSRGRKEAGLDK